MGIIVGIIKTIIVGIIIKLFQFIIPTIIPKLFCLIIIQLTTDYMAMELQIMYKMYLIAIKEVKLVKKLIYSNI